MNGYEIYDKAMTRLGYKGTDNTAVPDSRLVSRALEFINQIALDLKLGAVDDMSKEINCSAEFAEALCCGTAMLLSMCVSDTNKNVIFTAIYNAKRAELLSGISYIKDTLPVTEG